MSDSTTLYLVTCLITGKLYVGITGRTLEKRWRNHWIAAKNPKCRFHSAIRKYGADNFVIEPLHVYTTRSEAEHAEIVLIDVLDLTKVGYNAVSGGGIAPSQLGRKRSPETLAKMSAVMMGKPSLRKGVRHTADAIARMSASKKGVKKPPRTVEHRANLANAIRNMSAEGRANAAAAARIGWIKRKARNQEAALADALFAYAT